MSDWERHNQTPAKTAKKKTASDIDWIIDTREPESMSVQFETFKVPFKIRTLQSCDYQYGSAHAERKTIFDFTASFRNTRLFDQLEALREETCFPFLIITGTLEKLISDVHYKGINDETVVGAMASCMCRYGVNIIWVQDDTDAVYTMTQLFPRLQRYDPELTTDDKFMLVGGHSLPEGRSAIMDNMAEIIGEHGVNVCWPYNMQVGMRIMAKMFKKIGEGKRGQPRQRVLREKTKSRTVDIVRNFLRVEPALARSLVVTAQEKNKGVFRYIMEAKDSELIAHPGMGKVTLKRLREIVG